MGDGFMLGVLLASALRSLLLGVAAYGLLKLVRLRDARAETLAWTMVLVASLAMPFLSQWLPRGVTLPLPDLAPASHGSLILPMVSAGQPHAPRLSVAALVWGLYCIVAAVSLVRLALGVILSRRLYQTAGPIASAWAKGRNVRVSGQVQGPLSFGRCIVLPADYGDWSQSKLIAVLAHEEAHIEHGDFFIQLLASANRALFWFNPFAWWLQARLSELAETASDEAAIRKIQDAPRYAEILLEVARKSRPASNALGALGMARGPSVAKRLDYILAWRPSPALSLPGRAAGAGLLLAASVGLAQLHASIILTQPAPGNETDRPPAHEIVRSKVGRSAPTTRVHAEAGPVPNAASTDASPAPTVAAQTAPDDDFTYNPRALLDDPDFVPVASLLRVRKDAQPSD